MAEKTAISWADASWNPWTGCHKVSPGCDNCYMFRGMRRYGRNPKIVVRSRRTFDAPLHWKEPKFIFTCSWSDFFIKDADAWRVEAWTIMARTPWHTYQVLTKRPGLAVAWFRTHGWLPNVWLGVSVESQKYAPRLDVLKRIPAPVRFVSAEPLLSGLDLREWLRDGTLQWVICGGESGSEYRPMDIGWARSIKEQCENAHVPFWFKQSSGLKAGMDSLLDGKQWYERPAISRQVQLALEVEGI